MKQCLAKEQMADNCVYCFGCWKRSGALNLSMHFNCGELTIELHNH